MKNWDPAYYDAHCILQYNTAMKMLEEFSFEPNNIVLDIGSGSGKITNQIAQLVPDGHVTGVDISEKMVDFSRGKYQACNLDFTHCDILDMRYENQFDAIVSFWTLSWVENQALAFSNITHALKPDGKFLIMYPMRHDAYDVAEQIIQKSHWQEFFKDGVHLRPFMTEEQYLSACHSECMAMSVANKEIPCRFSSISEMQASIGSWMSHLDHFPNEALKQSFLDEFTQAYLSHRGLSEPTMFFSVLEVSGKKLAPSSTVY